MKCDIYTLIVLFYVVNLFILNISPITCQKNGEEMSATCNSEIESHDVLIPKLEHNNFDSYSFHCPKCKRQFDNFESCQMHGHLRKHFEKSSGSFCYINSQDKPLPKCDFIYPRKIRKAFSFGSCEIKGHRRTMVRYNIH